MFGGWAQLAGPPEDLTDNERSPPPAPTQLDFPGYLPQNPGNPLTPASSRELFRLLCSIRRPQDITPQHLQALNLSVVPDASFQDLLPPATGSDPRGPRQTGHQDRLRQIVQELRTDHADAFREILRLPPLPGRPHTRLSQTRRFWSGLESMSQYWDSSRDRYYETPATVNDDDNSDSNTSSSDADTTTISRTERTASETATDPPSNVQRTKQVYKGRRVGTGSAMPPTYRDDAVSALVETVAWAYNCQVRASHVPARLAIQNLLFPVRQSYIVGRVPREKELARRGVIEGPIMGICCRVETSFGDPASNGSGECDAAKEGWREILDLAREAGVMLLLAQERAREGKEEVKPGQGRWWTVTRRWGGGPGGSMVDDDCLPERTVRHDKSSACSDNAIPEEAVKKGPGNTNTVTVPSSQELSCAGVARPKRKAYAQEAGSSDVQSGVPQAKRGGGSGGSGSGSAGGKLQQRERWKILRAGSGLWDRRIKYMRIGAPSPRTSQQSVGGARGDADQDVIFMVSAINHHVALLSMEVSSRYLRWLAGGECEGDEQGQEQKQEQKQKQEQEQNTEEHAQGLQLKRTRWFDLFDQADRVDFVEGLWQVMDWLTREG